MTTARYLITRLREAVQPVITKYDIAARVTLAGLDGFRGRLSAAQQRQIFGRNIFGKKELRIDAHGQGQVKYRFLVSFGQDAEVGELSFDEIAALANTPDRPLSW